MSIRFGLGGGAGCVDPVSGGGASLKNALGIPRLEAGGGPLRGTCVALGAQRTLVSVATAFGLGPAGSWKWTWLLLFHPLHLLLPCTQPCG